MNEDVFQLAQRLITPAEETVKTVATSLLNYRGQLPKDTGFERGHEANEIDKTARDLCIGELGHRFPEYDGTIWTEDQPIEQRFLPTDDETEERRRLLFVIDECEGTTNFKRALHSPLVSSYRPDTGVSLAISISNSLADLAVSAFYDMRSNSTLSALRVSATGPDPEFLSFHDGRRLNKADFRDKRGDSAYRIIVAGYSNNRRVEIGKLSQVLHDSGFRVYGGSRASGVDLVSMLNNQYDAYVDLRAFLSRKVEGREMNAQLQVYDVCGMLPIMTGCGFKATDPFGRAYHEYDFHGKIPLIVARSAIHERILGFVRPFAEQWSNDLTK